MKLANDIQTHHLVHQSLEDQGFCVLGSKGLCSLLGMDLGLLHSFEPYWNSLAQDEYLKDLGKYRFRRHSSYKLEHGSALLVPHRAHWQSLDYNALHGGISRMFKPIESPLQDSFGWLKLIGGVAALFSPSACAQTLYCEAHQFRIKTIGGIGRPTPEGAHRDGVDFVAVILVARQGIKGGESRIFKIQGSEGIRFTLDEPWSILLMNDHRIMHETTPIRGDDDSGYRDTLVLTYRYKGFQEPSSSTV